MGKCHVERRERVRHKRKWRKGRENGGYMVSEWMNARKKERKRLKYRL